MQTYDGDVQLLPQPDGGEVTWRNGQPVMDAGLMTAVYISLYTTLGWWGGSAIGSTLEALEDGPLSNSVRLEFEQAIRSALAWLISDGIATAVDVESEIQGPGMLAVAITITEPDGSVSTYRYRPTWAATKEGL